MSDALDGIDYGEAFRLAIESERLAREEAYTELPAVICGVQVRQMEIRHLVILQLIDSPFVCGGVPGVADVAQFLWIVSPLFELGNDRKRDKFTRGCRKLGYVAASIAIRNYILDTFADAPSARDGGPSYAGWPSALVDLFASEYGWNEQTILALPLKRAWQYWRRIALRHDPKKVMFNPQSDAVKSEWLASLNTTRETVS